MYERSYSNKDILHYIDTWDEGYWSMDPTDAPIYYAIFGHWPESVDCYGKNGDYIALFGVAGAAECGYLDNE